MKAGQSPAYFFCVTIKLPVVNKLYTILNITSSIFPKICICSSPPDQINLQP